MREWALPLLRCVRCGHQPLAERPGLLECAGCGSVYPTGNGIGDFLAEPHATVAREVAAVASLDSADPREEATVRSLLGDLDRGVRVPPEDPRLRAYPSFAEVARSRRRVDDVLRRLGLEPGATVVELGADHCLYSGLALDAGWRVLAVDITDHLRLAPRADSPDLCRLRADMNRLPLADGVADAVWATACAHHSWSLERTFREAARVLGDRGLFVLVNEPMPAWPRYLLAGFGLGFGRRERQLGINENLHPRSRWLRAARRAGFEPRLIVPALDAEELAAALVRRRLPRRLAPLVARGAEWLQVSIHMIARRERAGPGRGILPRP